MKVRRDSWHYRLWRWGREDKPYNSSKRSEPRDLCRYFWHIALVKVLLPLIGAGLIVAGIVAIVIATFREPLKAGLIALAITCGLSLIWGLVIISGRIEDRRTAVRNGWAPAKEPGITRQYLAARKRKMCPLIEVVDDGPST